ncbi:hypothetical protein GQ55_3G453000 [Panicum hallii var. hallii]|uniref:Uncharacterized protein n=1 Tax=Panicum hallii var. hallii TaxID=1504633 RepID=A0A2T7EIJ9_9POAL|nr:hypothetical protein GQ55_3G453000 [Panicum hallii var. hallii]
MVVLLCPLSDNAMRWFTSDYWSCCSYWFGSTCIQRLRYCYSFWVQPLFFSLTLLHIDRVLY